MIANDQDSQVKDGGLHRPQTGTLSVIGQVIVTVSVCVIFGVGRLIRSNPDLSNVLDGLRNANVGHCLRGLHEIVDHSSTQ